jgi:hypothetical protein
MMEMHGVSAMMVTWIVLLHRQGKAKPTPPFICRCARGAGRSQITDIHSGAADSEDLFFRVLPNLATTSAALQPTLVLAI